MGKFGENIIDFARALEKDIINRVFVSQLVRSATSVGANYMEANQASSKKDFRNKIYICTKESNEIKHWLRMIAMANKNKEKECRTLWKEAHELTLILSIIAKSCKK